MDTRRDLILSLVLALVGGFSIWAGSAASAQVLLSIVLINCGAMLLIIALVVGSSALLRKR